MIPLKKKIICFQIFIQTFVNRNFQEKGFAELLVCFHLKDPFGRDTKISLMLRVPKVKVQTGELTTTTKPLKTGKTQN